MRRLLPSSELPAIPTVHCWVYLYLGYPPVSKCEILWSSWCAYWRLSFTYFLDTYSTQVLAGFKFGFLTIALNGLLTYLGLLAISYWDTEVTVKE